MTKEETLRAREEGAQSLSLKDGDVEGAFPVSLCELVLTT
jgi:hypothetical protein